MLEAVIPVSNKVEARRNLDRLDMLLKSFAFFWRGEDKFILNIVVPDDEYKNFSIWLRQHDILSGLKIHLISESQISTVLGSIKPAFGVLKQMLIKLSVFSFIKADYCLLLDSDIVACKPFSACDLIIDGRALTEWLRPTLHQWWFESARILGHEIPEGGLRQPRIFVTPQIFCRNLLEPMLQDVAHRLGTSWMMGLIAEYSGQHPNIWTEYTLYDLYAEGHGLRESYHVGPDESSNPPLHCMKQSIWGAHSFETWEPGRALDGADPGYFLVLQSITASQLDFDVVRQRWHEEIRARFPAYST
jgi:Family of unknown function (DUF6492)